jgi:integrase
MLHSRYTPTMAEPREVRPGVFALRAYVGRSASGSPIYLHETYTHPRKDGGIKEARKRLRGLEAQAQEQKSKSSDTFAALLDKWLDHSRRIGRSPNTIGGYESRVRAIKEALGSVRASALTTEMLDTWYAELLVDGGQSPANVKGFHRVISAALNRGLKWGTVPTNVALRAELPHVPHKEIEPPPAERVAALIRLARESKAPELADLIYLYAITGMRRAELCALRWSSVDWEGERVRVSRSIWQQSGRIGEKDTKTHQARWVPVGPVGVGILAARRDRAAAEAAAIELSLNPDGFVWSTDPSGMEPYRPDRITQAFRRYCRQAEAAAAKAAAEEGRELSQAERWPYRLHDLRHYSATELLDAGLSIVTVSRFLGHRHASTTSNIYAHTRDSDAEKITAVLGTSLAI